MFSNEVFVRISCYKHNEIIGQLHKLIRHPDKPVAAYVTNLAKGGSYYWVVELAFSCIGGYISIRLKPV